MAKAKEDAEAAIEAVRRAGREDGAAFRVNKEREIPQRDDLPKTYCAALLRELTSQNVALQEQGSINMNPVRFTAVDLNKWESPDHVPGEIQIVLADNPSEGWTWRG